MVFAMQNEVISEHELIDVERMRKRGVQEENYSNTNFQRAI
mgnify:CR=1 FL=1